MRTLIVIMLCVAMALFCSYIVVRSLRRGSVTYYSLSGLSALTHERKQSPFWYWFYTLAAGSIGIFMICMAVYYAFAGL
jgi:hypothetical protein